LGVKKPTNCLISKFTTSIGLVFVIFLTLIVTSITALSGVTHAGDNSQSNPGRLITIHDRGTEKVIVSQGETVGDVLKEAGISVDNKDAVEPAVTEKLVASDYQVNIYRARPVIIIDGNAKTKINTPYQTATQITESVGLKLYDEDKTELTLADNIIAEGASLKLIIDRATPFTFNLYGNTTTARTQANTIGEMLAEKGIKLGPDDKASLPADTKIIEGLAIKVWREGKQTITVEEEVKFETEKIQDNDRYIGYSEIRTAGQKGARTVTYEVLVENGQEVSRTEIASLIIKESKKQVEVIGVKRKVGTPDENRQYARAIMGGYGFGDDQWTCLDILWSHESGWDQYKTNYSGSGAYGIPQALPGSKMGNGWQDDPAVQINWGLNYIKGRYSTPCGAYAHWQSSNWY